MGRFSDRWEEGRDLGGGAVYFYHIEEERSVDLTRIGMREHFTSDVLQSFLSRIVTIVRQGQRRPCQRMCFECRLACFIVSLLYLSLVWEEKLFARIYFIILPARQASNEVREVAARHHRAARSASAPAASCTPDLKIVP